tara:strand:+ start:1776 stop:2378 length:603 start_codon:yes stop_codon:yes gene_type:complete
MTKLTKKQIYKIDSIDMSSINNKSQEVHTGYYDASVDPYRQEFVSNNLNIDFSVIISFSIIGAIIIFLFQFCLNNLGIDIKQTYKGLDTQDFILGKQNICQKPISLIFSFEYPFISIIGITILIALIIYLLHLFGILNSISEYFKEQKYYYDNEQPNLFTSILNTIDFTKGITKAYDCAINSVIDTDKINENYKKKYQTI